MKKILLGIGLVVALLAILRFRVLPLEKTASGTAKKLPQELQLGYLPVTCHLTCPVVDYATKTSGAAIHFKSQKFSDFPTIASAIQSKKLQVTFMLAPLAMKLREDGVPVKICYLGHRDGSELVIPINSSAKNLHDLKGKKIAIPSLYSNQHFVLLKLLEKQGLSPDDLQFVPLPPPDMPTALAAKAIDGYFVGEPFCAKAEKEGIGKVLYYARDIWPNFISCVLVVHEDLINNQPEVVKELVRGIAESGAWAEIHRADAAKIISRYNRQDSSLLNYILTSTPRRVSYVRLTPDEKELQEIYNVAQRIGLLKKDLPVKEMFTTEFIPDHVLPANIVMNK
ncbi:ABC transporter substrate-binding protein [Chitinophaga sancti]|uniref:ABC transporter substrate-binding protein n=1 Tax=Chitinophaga sancti TaxID=1004 RepID=UPI002A74B0D5|nr:ABC transporter substrate-binding protein [Chitinophaga sancti]WPQ66055.1 ABC transporter substrate-binding protein [Chitinophaga sancti]